MQSCLNAAVFMKRHVGTRLSLPFRLCLPAYSLIDGLSLRNLSDDVELSLDLRSFFGSINSTGAGVAFVSGGDAAVGDWRGARLRNEVGGVIFGGAIVGSEAGEDSRVM
jgi:hypothetical protein